MTRSYIREARAKILTLTCTKCGSPVPNRVQRRPVVICYECRQKDRQARNKARREERKNNPPATT